MRKFLSEQFLANVALPEEFREILTAFVKKYQTPQMSERVPAGLTALSNMSTRNQLEFLTGLKSLTLLYRVPRNLCIWIQMITNS